MSSTSFNTPRSHASIQQSSLHSSSSAGGSTAVENGSGAGNGSSRRLIHKGGGSFVAAGGASNANETTGGGGSASAYGARQKAVSFDPPLWLQRQQWLLESLSLYEAKSILDIGCGEGALLTALARPALGLDAFPWERYSELAASAPKVIEQKHMHQLPEEESGSSASASAASSGPSSPATKLSSLSVGATSAFKAAAETPSGGAASASKLPAQAPSSSQLLPTSHWIYAQRAPSLSPTQLSGLDLSAEDLLEAEAQVESVLAEADERKEARWEPLELRLLRGNLAQNDASLTGQDAIVATEV